MPRPPLFLILVMTHLQVADVGAKSRHEGTGGVKHQGHGRRRVALPSVGVHVRSPPRAHGLCSTEARENSCCKVVSTAGHKEVDRIQILAMTSVRPLPHFIDSSGSPRMSQKNTSMKSVLGDSLSKNNSRI